MTLPIALILGPTASGKTGLALELARVAPGGGECICADSMQVYRGMDIGTAKPTAAEQASVRHHLLDVADPALDDFSVDTWLRHAEEAIDDIHARGHLPIVVGGTNLYVKALLEGLFDGPEPDRALRERLDALDEAELRQWLLRVDPVAAERIHTRDRKRTVRAIEVHTLTGRPLSDHQQEWDRGHLRTGVRIIGLEWPTETINRRINDRVRQMITDGLVEEVRALSGALGRQATAALGYRQILDHFVEGGPSLEDAIEQIKIKTRRFAKQQRTWMRRFRHYADAKWLDASEFDTQALVQQSLEWITTAPADAASRGKDGIADGSASAANP